MAWPIQPMVRPRAKRASGVCSGRPRAPARATRPRSIVGCSSDQLAAGLGESLGQVDRRRSGAISAASVQQGRAAGIAVRIERMAEAGDLLAPAQAVGQRPAALPPPTRFAEQRLHPLRVAAVPRPLERREAGRDHVPGEAAAEATQRAVKAETLSSWSAARIRAAPIGARRLGGRARRPAAGAWRRSRAGSRPPAATPARNAGCARPVAATAAGRRSQAARSAAPASGRATWQRSTGVRPSWAGCQAGRAGGFSGKSLAASAGSPVQISAATSSTVGCGPARPRPARGSRAGRPRSA